MAWSIPRLLDGLLLILVVVLFTDLALFGPGIQIPLISLPLRRLFFVAIVFLATFRHFFHREYWARSELLLVLLSTLLIVVWVVALPTIYGFELADSVADAIPWLALLILSVWPWDAWPRQEQWTGFCRFLLFLGAMLAIAHILIWALLAMQVISSQVLSLINQLVFVGEEGADSFIKSAPIPGAENRFRVYWSSSVFLLCTLYLAVAHKAELRRSSYYISLLLTFAALWITQIRAFLAAALLYLVLGPIARLGLRIFGSSNAALVILGLWVAGIAGVSLAINPAVLGGVGLSREESDLPRLDQASALLDQAMLRPILGSGFGSYTTSVVRSEQPYSYELVFHALLMKVGVAGLAVLGLVLLCALSIARVEALFRTNPWRAARWGAFTTGLWFSGATNPLVVNFVGMGVLVILLVDARYAGISDRTQ